MKTETEIVERIRAAESDDWLGTQRTDLLSALPFVVARPFLIPDATDADWEQRDEATIRAVAVDYLTFAFGKAIDHRGISAGRSVDHYAAWLWLLGLDDGFADVGYAQYGVPKLLEAARRLEVDPYALPVVAADREMVERMGRGEPCEPGCDEGCAR